MSENVVTLDEVFDAGGLLSKKLPGYAPRVGQVAMAHAVESTIERGGELLVEAPCGTGKSIAYLVPAILREDRRNAVVVVTQNIALQEQLTRKDLPFLASVLPKPFTYALLKGRNNYLCKSQLALEAERVAGFMDTRHISEEAKQQIREIVTWGSMKTTTGDVSELPFDPKAVWHYFSSSTDECGGEHCRFHRECWGSIAKAEARHADVVVTNYHLLYSQAKFIGLNAAKADGTPAGFLPWFDVLICDEAHEAVDVARSFAGIELSLGSFYSLARRAAKVFGKDTDHVYSVRRAADKFFDALGRHVKKHSREPFLRTSSGFPILDLMGAVRVLKESVLPVLRNLRAVMKAAGVAGTKTTELVEAEVLAHLCGRRLQDLEAFSEYEDDGLFNTIYYIEGQRDDKRAEQYRLKSREINVAPFLAGQVWEEVPAAILTSATLAIANDLTPRRNELGLTSRTDLLIVESPFNFHEQAILCVPKEANLPPDPKADEVKFADAVARALVETIRICEGRTLALFTSWKNLELVYERVSKVVKSYRLLKQGDLPRVEMARVFREDEHSVLFGVDSFWQGIDVPGDALLAVVIDKLPFPNLSDPVTAAIQERDGDKAFASWFIPEAVTKFRQGVGRLIRRVDDIGIVVVCDRRLMDKAYGVKFRNSLPGWGVCTDFGYATRFLSRRLAARGAVRRSRDGETCSTGVGCEVGR